MAGIAGNRPPTLPSSGTPGDSQLLRQYANDLESARIQLLGLAYEADMDVTTLTAGWFGAGSEGFVSIWDRYYTPNPGAFNPAWTEFTARQSAALLPQLKQVPQAYAYEIQRQLPSRPAQTQFQAAMDACAHLSAYLLAQADAIDQAQDNADRMALLVGVTALAFVATVVTLGVAAPALGIAGAGLFFLAVGVGAVTGGGSAAAIAYGDQVIDNVDIHHDDWSLALGAVDGGKVASAAVEGAVIGGATAAFGMGLGTFFQSSAQAIVEGSPMLARVLGSGAGAWLLRTGAQTAGWTLASAAAQAPFSGPGTLEAPELGTNTAETLGFTVLGDLVHDPLLQTAAAAGIEPRVTAGDVTPPVVEDTATAPVPTDQPAVVPEPVAVAGDQPTVPVQNDQPVTPAHDGQPVTAAQDGQTTTQPHEQVPVAADQPTTTPHDQTGTPHDDPAAQAESPRQPAAAGGGDSNGNGSPPAAAGSREPLPPGPGEAALAAEAAGVPPGHLQADRSGHFNEVYTYTLDDGTVRYFKPMGEAEANRAIAFSRMAEWLGFGEVTPVTAPAEFAGHGTGIVMESLGEGSRGTPFQYPDLQQQMAAVLDYLGANPDRAQNFMDRTTGGLGLFDPEGLFPAKNDGEIASPWLDDRHGWFGHELDTRITDALGRLTPEELQARLQASGIDPEAAAGAARRLAEVQGAGRITGDSWRGTITGYGRQVRGPLEPPHAPVQSSATDTMDRFWGGAGGDQPVAHQDEIVHALRQIDGLRPETWKTLDPGQRVEVLQRVEDTVAGIQGRQALPVRSARLSRGTLGEFDPSTGTLRINEVALKHGTLMDGLGHVFNVPGSERSVLETVLHEGRHAYQYVAIANPGFEPDAGRVSAWAENLRPGRYQAPSDWNPIQFYKYWTQPVEVDARSFQSMAELVLDGIGDPARAAPALPDVSRLPTQPLAGITDLPPDERPPTLASALPPERPGTHVGPPAQSSTADLGAGREQLERSLARYRADLAAGATSDRLLQRQVEAGRALARFERAATTVQSAADRIDSGDAARTLRGAAIGAGRRIEQGRGELERLNERVGAVLRRENPSLAVAGPDGPQLRTGPQQHQPPASPAVRRLRTTPLTAPPATSGREAVG